jgi:hypothetical protein
MNPLISAADLAEFRAMAEGNMQDACTITRVDPEASASEMDPDTLEYPPAARITVYSGKCRVQIKSVIASSSGSDAGERQATTQEFEVQLPVAGTGGVAITDVVHIDTAMFDSSLEGREFTVVARHEKTHATARRLRVIEGTA